MTIKITQLGNVGTKLWGNTIVPLVANVAGDWTTLKGNLDQIGTYINQAELLYGNIIPVADATYSLGTASYRFKDLYLLGSTIYLGNATISVSNAAVVTSLPLTAPSVTVGNTTISGSGNISVNSISVTDAITASNITAAGSVTATDVTTTGTVTAGDVTTTGNITAANIEVSGDIITLGGTTLDVSSGSLEVSVPIVTSSLFVGDSEITEVSGGLVLPSTRTLYLQSFLPGNVNSSGTWVMDRPKSAFSTAVVVLTGTQPPMPAPTWTLTEGVDFTISGTDLTITVSHTVTNIICYETYADTGDIVTATTVAAEVIAPPSDDLTIDGNLTISADFKLVAPSVPTSNSSPGYAGTIAWDSDYIYICVASDTWKRANISTW